jgi:hypothetical protein
MMTISETVFRSIWNGVEAAIDVPGMREDLLEVRRNDIAHAWEALDEGIKRDGLVLAPSMLDPVARELFFPYELMALNMRARAEALQEATTDGPPN